jgi:hypothetical protein
MCFFFQKTVAQMGEDEEEEEWELAAMAAAIIWLGAEEVHIRHAEGRQQTRLYLCRPQLLPNLWYDTPWQHLYTNSHDCAFITTMGFDVQAFHDIIDASFGPAWYSAPIPRTDVSTAGNPCPGAQSLLSSPTDPDKPRTQTNKQLSVNTKPFPEIFGFR